MKTISIQYCFKLDEQRHEVFDLLLDSDTLEIVDKTREDLPAWTKLDFHQCPHCPLDPANHPECPVAVSLIDVAKRFDDTVSYDELDLEVITAERRIIQHTTMQRGLSSLVGLLIAASGCPHTAFFKPMARLHLPLATEEDTIFRATGMYLLAQYFVSEEGHKGDFELKGLKKIYNNLHLLNIEIAKRLRSSTQKDSYINAIVLLDFFATTLPFAIEDKLEEIRPWFTPYFSDFYRNIIETVNALDGSGRGDKDT
jgi:hypothetical protein